MPGIYKITNKINNKIYVGSAANIHVRWTSHRNKIKKNYHENLYLQNAWNKYGEESFLFEIIEEIENKELLLEREQYYLDLYKSYERDKGYNICPKAKNCLGKKTSDEVKEKLSLAQKKRFNENGDVQWNKGIPWSEEQRKKLIESRQKEKNGFYNKTHSQESKDKMSISHKGKIQAHTCKLIWEIVNSIRKDFIPGINTFAEFGRKHRVNEATIGMIIKNKTWKINI